MAERKIIVFIYLPGETTAVPAGIFTHEDDPGIGAFAYGRRYLERENALAVDPVALPLGSNLPEVTNNLGLYGAFRDASPDYWGRLVMATEAQTPPEAISEIDFLLAANATRVGNLDFRPSPVAPETLIGPPHFNRLAEIIEAAGSIESGEAIERHLLQLLRQGTSVGGARPKCTVEWEDALWIAKFPAREDTLNMPRIEYATMTLARRCGICIPDVRIINIGEKDIFLSRRFDREKTKEGWTRKGFLSALSLMQWDERDRLRWDYAAIGDQMRRFTPAAGIEELFSRMIFNILVRNTDDHPRNHGFVIDGPDLSLSPAYDIVPSLSRTGIGTDFRLAMSVGNQGREANIENALSRCSRFGVSPATGKKMVRKLVETVGTWRDHFEECGVSGNDIDLLAPSFENTTIKII
ncbi:MAG: HipA domain-containing protein [Desulfobacterales bacterium]|nr:HipA domain-containing protein [Desulfobacterales bacterium]